jgi:hypothetical protein
MTDLGDLAVVGLVRNGQASVSLAVDALATALPPGRTVHWMVIESDSDDDTAGVLQQLALSRPGFQFQSLGRLSTRFPRRTDRIAQCRNAGLQWLEDLRAAGMPVSHLLMADLDGVNNGLTAQALASCWQRSDWHACTANQAGRYYDLWALRHPVWCPGDCWEEADFLTEHGVPRDRAKMAAVYLRMLHIRPDRPWIEVQSAFGGLAIYRAEAIAGLRYAGLTPEGEEICEHVPFHAALRARGGRIYINPALLNGSAGDGASYWPGAEASLRRRTSWRLRVALWLAFGPREGRALRQAIEGLR